jgi:hypothetical protein
MVECCGRINEISGTINLREISFSFERVSASRRGMCFIRHRHSMEEQLDFTQMLPYHTRVHPKVSGLAAWSENCKWYSSLPLGAVVSLFRESV